MKKYQIVICNLIFVFTNLTTTKKPERNERKWKKERIERQPRLKDVKRKMVVSVKKVFGQFKKNYHTIEITRASLELNCVCLFVGRIEDFLLKYAWNFIK